VRVCACCVCMCVHIYACMVHTYVYVCVCTRMCAWWSTYYACVRAWWSTYYACVYDCVCSRMCVWWSMWKAYIYLVEQMICTYVCVVEFVIRMFLQDFSCLCLCLNLVTCLQHTARYCNTHGLVPCSRICRFTCTHRHPLHMHGQTPTITNLCARSTRFAAKNNNLFFATCVCIYPSIYSYIHTHVCIYLRVYIYMYIYIYIHMYILV